MTITTYTDREIALRQQLAAMTVTATEYQQAADKMAMAHKVERDALTQRVKELESMEKQNSDTITLPRSVVAGALHALDLSQALLESSKSIHHTTVLEEYKALRAALAQQAEQEGWARVPVNPPEQMWGGLARDMMMWLDMYDRKTPANLFKHLDRCGTPIPQWLSDEPEMQNLDHVSSKGTRVVIIYKAMLAAAPKGGV